jgi:alkylation response protein AidB-like acyl-CoA dehydrogenase
VDFSLSEEQLLLRDSIEKYVGEHLGVDRHRGLAGGDTGFDPAAWAQFAELGWLSVSFSEELGGFDGGATDLMVVGEALGKGHVREPFLHTVVTCGGLLQRGSSGAQQKQYIAAIIDGSAQWALAVAEQGSGYYVDRVATQAQPREPGYSLSGAKLTVLNGHCADHLVVSAQTPEGISLFIVDASAEGVSREAFTAVDGSRGAHIRFDGVALDADALLGEPGEGVALLEGVFDQAAVAIGGEALGAMQALLDATVEYTSTRQQFGQPISKFQVLQHRMADMYMKLEETRSLLLNAAIQLEEGSDEAAAACAALRVKVSEAGRFVAQEAVQLHGGIGMTDELAVSHHYKRLMLLAKLYGDEGYYLRRFTALTASEVVGA